MKHKFLFSLLLLLLPFCLSSCVGDEDESNPLVGHTFRCQMGSFSTSLYKDNSSSLLRPNDKFGSMYADTDPVSGTLKNDAGSAFSIFFN